MTDVSIFSCPDYSEENVRRALLGVLAPLGSLDWIRPGMKIAIKANLVSCMKPEEAATTHPALLCELVKMIMSGEVEDAKTQSAILKVWYLKNK